MSRGPSYSAENKGKRENIQVGKYVVKAKQQISNAIRGVQRFTNGGVRFGPITLYTSMVMTHRTVFNHIEK